MKRKKIDNVVQGNVFWKGKSRLLGPIQRRDRDVRHNDQVGNVCATQG